MVSMLVIAEPPRVVGAPMSTIQMLDGGQIVPESDAEDRMRGLVSMLVIADPRWVDVPPSTSTGARGGESVQSQPSPNLRHRWMRNRSPVQTLGAG
jgi:hypothetical protein